MQALPALVLSGAKIVKNFKLQELISESFRIFPALSTLSSFSTLLSV